VATARRARARHRCEAWNVERDDAGIVTATVTRCSTCAWRSLLVSRCGWRDFRWRCNQADRSWRSSGPGDRYRRHAIRSGVAEGGSEDRCARIAHCAAAELALHARGGIDVAE